MRLFVTVLLLLGVATAAQAEQHVTQGQQLAWEHDGLHTDRYEVCIDNQPCVSIGKPTPTGETYRTPVPAMTPGPHTVKVQACNMTMCNAASIDVVMVLLPAKPLNLRIEPTSSEEDD